MLSLKTKRTILNTSLALLLATALSFASFVTVWAAPGDYDNDGVANAIDLDGDNDGILNKDECEVASMPAPIDPDAKAVSWSDGDIDVFTYGGEHDALNYQKSGFQRTFVNSSIPFTHLNGATEFTLAPNGMGEADNVINFNGGNVTYEGTGGFAEPYKFIVSGGSAASGGFGDAAFLRVDGTVQNAGDKSVLNVNLDQPVNMFAFDLVDITDSSQHGDNRNFRVNVLIDDQLKAYFTGRAHQVSVTDYNLYDAAGNLKGTITAGNNVETSFGFVSSTRFQKVSFEYVIEEGGFRFEDWITMDNFIFGTACDANNDGTPNYLDLDSDRDDCFDALEGEGHLTEADLNADGSIIGSVNASGIPTLVGDTGQGVGYNTYLAHRIMAEHPLTDRTYQVGDQIEFRIGAIGVYSQMALSFDASGEPDYTGASWNALGMSYQWQVSTDDGATFNDIPGETSSMTLTGTAAIDGNIYRLMANCLSRTCYKELTRSKLTMASIPPVVSSSTITVDEESTATSLGLSAPTDADGDTLTITVTGLPTLGVVKKDDGTVVNNGDTLTSAELTGLIYDAPNEYNGTDVVGNFTYGVSDGDTTVTGTTTINVNPVNDPPVIVTHDITIKTGGNIGLLSLVDSVTDDEDGSITVSAANVTITNQGGFNPNVPGVYTITYSATDTKGSTATQTAQVTVNAPVVVTTHDKEILVGETVVLSSPFLISFTDPEGDPVTVNVVNTGGFDNNKPGIYTIKYEVIDNVGNVTLAAAKIKVVKAHVFDPPSARKIVTNTAPEMEWKMVWINDGNVAALNTQVLDSIPAGTTYVTGSLKCEARGTSTTTICTYDAAENRIRWEGNIDYDVGGTNEANSANEVVITFKTTVSPEVDKVENQAMAYYDKDQDGDFHNDKNSGLAPVLTDNSNLTNATVDPTVWRRDNLANTGDPVFLIMAAGALMVLGAGLTPRLRQF